MEAVGEALALGGKACMPRGDGGALQGGPASAPPGAEGLRKTAAAAAAPAVEPRPGGRAHLEGVAEDEEAVVLHHRRCDKDSLGDERCRGRKKGRGRRKARTHVSV